VKVRSLVAAAVAAAASFAFAKPVAAQEPTKTSVDIDWRQHDRSDHFDRTKLEFPSLVFDLRFGGYAPRVDTDPALHGKTPYKDAFGSGPRFLLGFEVDWTPLRIPYLGAIGPGVSFGWVGSSTLAKIDTDHNPSTGTCKGSLDGCYSAQTTSLTIFPMYVVAVLRIDDPMVRYGIPIVPYLKLGLDGAIWTAGSSAPKDYIDPTTQKVVSSSGWSWGEHLGLGAALSLNWLDRDAVNRSREASGVRDFYLFGELSDYDVGILGPSRQLRVGSGAWVVGISLDF
jgi:hypothetical protein